MNRWNLSVRICLKVEHAIFATVQQVKECKKLRLLMRFFLHLSIDSMRTYTIMSVIMNLQNLGNANMKHETKSFGMSACLPISLAVKF